MAYALRGSLGAVVQSASGGAISGLAYGQTPVAGNLLIAWWCGQGTVATPVTPSGWTAVAQGGSTAELNSLFYKVAAGGDAVPAFGAVAAEVQTVMLGEFSGNATATPLDVSGRGSVTVVSGNVISSSGSDAAVGELFVAVLSAFYSTAATRTLTNVFNCGTAIDTNNNAASSANHYAFGYCVTTSLPLPDRNSPTLSTISKLTNASAGQASFKLASLAALLPTQAHHRFPGATQNRRNTAVSQGRF